MKITKIFSAALIAASMAQAAFAQSVSITPFTVQGLVAGRQFVMDADFSAEFNIPVPAPFRFTAPTSDDYQLYTQPAPGGTGIFKISFVNMDQQVMSNLQFVPMTVSNTDMQAQLDGLQTIVQQVFVAAVADLERSELTTVQITKIGDMPALEAIGRYDGGADGIVILRVVAIPNPNGVDGIVALINALVDNNNMDSIGDVLTIEASRALASFRFD